MLPNGANGQKGPGQATIPKTRGNGVSSEALKADVEKLQQLQADSSQRMQTGHQLQVEKKPLVKVAVGNAGNVAEMKDGHNKINSACAHQQAFHTVGSMGQKLRDTKMGIVVEKEQALDTEGIAKRDALKKSTKENLEEIAKFYGRIVNDAQEYDADFKLRREKGVSLRAVKAQLVEMHGKQKQSIDFKEQVSAYVAREVGDYDGARAKAELDRFLADFEYVPLLPPGRYEDWLDNEEWFKILYYFLEIVKSHIGDIKDWPATFEREQNQYHWKRRCGMKKPMNELLLPLFRDNFVTISALSGFIEAGNKDKFIKAIESGSKTFLSHYNGKSGLGVASAYFTQIYPGIITYLRILQDIREGRSLPDVTDSIGDTDGVDLDMSDSILGTDAADPEYFGWSKKVVLGGVFDELKDKRHTDQNAVLITETIRRLVLEEENRQMPDGPLPDLQEPASSSGSD